MARWIVKSPWRASEEIASCSRKSPRLFLENYRDWLGELRHAEALGDAQMVERTAHGLKGSVANFGARDAVEASMKLENLGRSRDLAGATESLAALESALETLRGDLESL